MKEPTFQGKTKILLNQIFTTKLLANRYITPKSVMSWRNWSGIV